MKKLQKNRKELKTKPFINIYSWKGINYPSREDEWNIFEKNDPTIALISCILKK